MREVSFLPQGICTVALQDCHWLPEGLQVGVGSATRLPLGLRGLTQLLGAHGGLLGVTMH